MGAKTLRNILFSLLLSVVLTLLFTALYTFYPIISMIVSLMWRQIASSGPQTGGISATAGGLSASLLGWVLLVAVFLFFIIFAFLQKGTR